MISSTDFKGYTLPVWVAAAAKSATQLLKGRSFNALEKVNLLNNEPSLSVPISASGLLENGKKALAISFCDSGLALDITCGLEIWTFVEFHHRLMEETKEINDGFPEWLDFVGGEGLGKFENTNKTCLSKFARELIIHNLYPLLEDNLSIRLEVVFPKGTDLALRTSNRAFGIIDGLSLIGTQAEVQDSASPEQLKKSLGELNNICSRKSFDGSLIFVIGENGLDLAQRLSFPSETTLKTGNWLGPLIIAAAKEGVQNLLLFGYHGKLVKLAGGIFHTHHHLADGRLEILTALAVQEEVPFVLIKLMSKASSMEEALVILENEDPKMAFKLWKTVAEQVEQRSFAYVNRYFSSSSMKIGALMFDRKRQIRWAGSMANEQIVSFGMDVIR